MREPRHEQQECHHGNLRIGPYLAFVSIFGELALLKVGKGSTHTGVKLFSGYFKSVVSISGAARPCWSMMPCT